MKYFLLFGSACLMLLIAGCVSAPRPQDAKHMKTLETTIIVLEYQISVRDERIAQLERELESQP